jgi:hypothetical protein
LFLLALDRGRVVAGPDHSQAFARYRAVARTKDGKVGNGQPGPSAQAALALVPWADLEK